MRCSTSPATTWPNPLEILMVWKGGMSFHGGLLGVIAAMALFARSARRPF
jgi:phosphatidylglycerol---prolipoprotein diacylglyceryl transferase